MYTFVLRLVVNVFSIWVAVKLIDGVYLTPGANWVHFVLIGLVFGVLNALVKPILVFFSIPAIVLTMGLFYLVINALILWLTAAVVGPFVVTGFWAAVWGGLVISVLNWLLGGLVER